MAVWTNTTIYSLGVFRVKYDSASARIFYLPKSRKFNDVLQITDIYYGLRVSATQRESKLQARAERSVSLRLAIVQRIVV